MRPGVTINTTIRRSVALALLCGLAISVAQGQSSLSPARQREILREALSAYDQAVAMARESPDRAMGSLRAAAAGFQALIDAGVQNADLEYNLGNTYFRLGELGRAVLHYRRAARLDPHDPRLTANLRYARDRVEPRITPSGEQRLSRQLLFWHYQTSLRQRTWLLVSLSVIGWALAFVWLWWPRRPLLITGLVIAALGLAAGGSILWQLRAEATHPPAVVVDHVVPLRLGRDENADLALRQPLGPGVELVILDRRGDWLEVRLPNAQTGWLPANAIEEVVP